MTAEDYSSNRKFDLLVDHIVMTSCRQNEAKWLRYTPWQIGAQPDLNVLD